MRHVQKGLHLGKPRGVGAHHAWHDFERGLHRAFGPAKLLALKSGVAFWQLGGHHHVWEVAGGPTCELAAVGEVHIFG